MRKPKTKITKRYMASVAALYGNAAPPKARKVAKRRTYPERDKVHLPVMAWAKQHPICAEHLLHIPNERKCSPQEGAMLKALGVKSGASDLFLAFPSRGYSGLWMELKAPGGVPTASQRAWLSLMEKVGYCVGCFDDSERAINALKWYLQEIIG